MLVALTPYVGLASVGVLLLALLSARRWLVVAVAVVVALQLSWQLPLYVADASPTGGPVLTVATINLKFGEADADAIVELVRLHDIDILALEELTPEARGRLADAGLDDVLPHSAVRPAESYAGTGLWSRTPMLTGRSVEGYASAVVVESISTELGVITVVAAHPVAPGLIDHEHWSRELAALTTELEALPGPVLVAADLNTTRDQAPLRRLEARRFRDAADQAGAGLHMTYPAGPGDHPVVAIDHVLARDLAATATSYAVLEVAGSDHHGVVATYS